MATKKASSSKKTAAKKVVPVKKEKKAAVPAKKVVAAKPAPKKPAPKPAPKVAKKTEAKKVAPVKVAAKKTPAAKKEPATKKTSVPAVKPAPAPVNPPKKRGRPAKDKSVVTPVAVDKASRKVKPVPANEVSASVRKQMNFAMAIANQMKQMAQDEMARDAKKEEIKLSSRPTSRSATKKTNKFPAADLKQFKKMLQELRDSVLGRSGALKSAALEQNDERVAEDDDGTDAFMRLQTLGQVGNQNQTILKIDEALHKINDGSYGVCEVCGQLIRKQRLMHLPFAHTCMECQSAMEKDR